jgi:hypothetical protein
MKTIILVILLSVFIKAQDHILTHEDSLKIEEMTKVLSELNAKWTPSFLALTKAYRNECYADSSLQTFSMYRYDNDTAYRIKSKYDIDPAMNSNYIGEVTKYIHREPTFKGFLEFIKQWE